MNKPQPIFIIRHRDINIKSKGDRYHAQIEESRVARLKDISSHFEPYFMFKETEKCIWIASREDDTPYRQLKDTTTYFFSRKEAMQYVFTTYSNMLTSIEKYADSVQSLRLSLVQAIRSVQ